MTSPTDAVFRRVFHASPTAMLLLDGELRVVDVNAAYLAATGHTVVQLLGRVVFEPFPDNPADPAAGSAAAVRESMQRAWNTVEVDQLVGRRYDIQLPGTDRFVTRYWNLTTVPVVDQDGRVEVLLHRVQDVTAVLASEAAEAAALEANSQLLERVASAQADLLVRARELQTLNDALRRAGRHDRTVAQTLQSAMLPRLPQVAGLELAGRYLPAALDDEVGGDWYDAVVDPEGAVTLMIGDVMGHDIDAAATMGQLRSMLRAFTWDRREPPSEIVALLDRAMRDLDMRTMATLTVVHVQAAAAHSNTPPNRPLTLRWSVAGHPPAMLVAPDGVTTVLEADAVGPPLGVERGAARRDTTCALPAGSAVVLYTDGLIETRAHDLDHGIDRLRRALTAHHHLPLPELLDAVIVDLVGDRPADDVAIIALRADTANSSVDPG